MALPINIENLLGGLVVEGNRVEYKKGWNPAPIYRTIYAFANDFDDTCGGYIVVGVDEVDGRAVRPVVGIDINEIEPIEKAMVGYNNLIAPYYQPRVFFEPVDGIKLLTDSYERGGTKRKAPLLGIDHNDEPKTHASKYHPTNSAGEVFTDKTIWVQHKEPEPDEITDEQVAYIDGRFDAFEDALAGDRFKDDNEGYRQHIDVTSFTDYQLATEIANNIDGYRLSTYLYKHRDSVDPRFKMTLWDFDLTWGLPDFENIHTGYMTDIWTYKNNDAGLGTKMPFWFDRLMSDPSYVAQLKARYAEYRKGRYADVPAVIDSLSTLLTAYGAADRDHQAWPRWGEVIYHNHYIDATTYAEEVAYVRRFAAARIAWLDEQLGYHPTAIGSAKPEGETHPQHIYSPEGIRRSSLQPGLNIIRYSNGNSKKIWRSQN